MHTPTPWYCGVGETLIMANDRPGAEHKLIAVCGRGTLLEQADYDNRDHIVKCVNQHDDLVTALKAWEEYAKTHPVPSSLAVVTHHALNNKNYIAPAGWTKVAA
jgi:hypothetical protein